MPKQNAMIRSATPCQLGFCCPDNNNLIHVNSAGFSIWKSWSHKPWKGTKQKIRAFKPIYSYLNIEHSETDISKQIGKIHTEASCKVNRIHTTNTLFQIISTSNWDESRDFRKGLHIKVDYDEK